MHLFTELIYKSSPLKSKLDPAPQNSLVKAQANLKLPSVGPALAATAGVIAIQAVSRTRLASIGAVGQIICSRLAAGVSSLASEDAGIHIRVAAARRVDRHDVSAHVYLSRDIDGGIVSGGEFSPCIIDLSILAQGRLVVVERCEATGDTVCQRNSDAISNVGERVRDHWCSNIHEARSVVTRCVVPYNNGYWYW